MELRPYQSRCIGRARRAYREGKRSILIAAPTGAGKTIIGSTIAVSARSRGSNVLWLAHRDELVEQAKSKLYGNIHVATVQGLLASGARPPADVVVFDEAHHFVADKWATVAEHYSGALRIGLTATPQRGDGTGLGDMFDELVVAAEYSELLRAGHIVDCDVVAPESRGRKLATPVEEAVKEYAGGKQSIVFVSTVAEAHRVAGAIGPTAEAVEGATKRGIRRDTIRAFRSGRIQHLVNVYVLTEGFDAPTAEVCVLGRGCSVEATYVQMVGRVLRTAPGKRKALLVDLCGVCHDFGMPTDDRVYALTKKKCRKPKVAPLWVCKVCRKTERMRPSGGRCGGCGALIPTPKAIAVKERTLARREAQSKASVESRRAKFDRDCAKARERGYKPGWVWFRYKEAFGTSPPWPIHVHALKGMGK